MKKWTLVSLGMSCQTAHQLARFAKNHPARACFQKGPFDWLICPPENAAAWLDSDLQNFNASELSVNRDHAYWGKFGFWFWHGFYTKTNDQKVLDLKANSVRELEKLNHQRSEFQNLKPENTQFFISNTQNNLAGDVFSTNELQRYHFTDDGIAKLQLSLDRYFNTCVNLHIITHQDRSNPSLLSKSNTHQLFGEPSEWKGMDSDWDRLLNGLLIW